MLTDFKPRHTEIGKISKDDELIRKSANGVFVMYKSNFDFLEMSLLGTELATTHDSSTRLL